MDGRKCFVVLIAFALPPRKQHTGRVWGWSLLLFFLVRLSSGRAIGTIVVSCSDSVISIVTLLPARLSCRFARAGAGSMCLFTVLEMASGSCVVAIFYSCVVDKRRVPVPAQDSSA